MKVEIFVTGIISTNCYVVHNEETKEAIIVDPAAFPKKLRHYLEDERLDVKAVLLTHGHFDHIMGLDDLLDQYDVPVYVHEDEKELISDPILNESRTYTKGYAFDRATFVRDGQVLDLIGYHIRVIHTPGHTSGGVSYYVEGEDVLFSGDTLFHGSVGRTDFKTSSMSALVHSIREKLFLLPDETVVYPGHMGATSIGTEKKINPYV